MWKPITALTCIESPTGAQSDGCPVGFEHLPVQIYVPTHDPSVPTAEQAEFAGVGFTIVVAVWITAKMLGILIRFVRGV